MDEAFALQVTQNARGPVVRLAGELDLDAAPAFAHVGMHDEPISDDEQPRIRIEPSRTTVGTHDEPNPRRAHRIRTDPYPRGYARRADPDDE